MTGERLSSDVEQVYQARPWSLADRSSVSVNQGFGDLEGKCHLLMLEIKKFT